MSKTIYDKNIEALSERYEYIADLLEQKKYVQSQEVIVFSQEAKTGEIVYKVESKGRTLYIDGKYNPKAPVDQWMEQQSKFERNSVVFVVGLANGYLLKRLIEETPQETVIVVYEPCIEIFLSIIKDIDITWLFKERAIGLIIHGLNEDELDPLLRKVISYDNIGLMHFYVHGNYIELFSKLVENFIKKQKSIIKKIMTNWNTIVRYTCVNGKNVLTNMKYLYNQYSNYQLKDILEKGVPAIIVSAGPSLNKNIDELKNAVGKACIIATDTAMKPLLNRGIVPDLFMVVDGLKPLHLFEHERISEVPMAMSSVVASEVSDYHTGTKYFSWDGDQLTSDLLQSVKAKSKRPEKINMLALLSGGSVANNAYSLAEVMGAKTIILVGQDLALTGNKSHADGTFEDKMKEIDYSKKEFTYIEIEDINGEKVYTRPDFKNYLDWFEERIKNSPDKKIIDATEGGAKIAGTEIITLKEAIERECRPTSLASKMKEVHPLFEQPEEKEAVKAYFESIIKEISTVKKNAEKGIVYYDKMIQLCSKQKVDEAQLIKLSKKITKINQYMDSNPVALFVIGSMKGLEYTLRPTIYKTEDNEKDERIMIAKQGKLLLNTVSLCVDELLPIAEKELGHVGEQ